MNGFENASTEELMTIRDNLDRGLAALAAHLKAGTFKVSKKEGSAPPAESGWLTLALLLGVEDELEVRVRGFQRILDPKLLAL